MSGTSGTSAATREMILDAVTGARDVVAAVYERRRDELHPPADVDSAWELVSTAYDLLDQAVHILRGEREPLSRDVEDLLLAAANTAAGREAHDDGMILRRALRALIAAEA